MINSNFTACQNVPESVGTGISKARCVGHLADSDTIEHDLRHSDRIFLSPSF
jgi:hypothetical protein